MFSSRPVPAVGFSFGLERVLEVLEERGLFPVFEGHAHAVVGVLDAAVVPWALDAVSAWRAQGLNVDLFPEITAMGKIMKWVDRKKVKFVLLVGSNEMERETIAWKNLQTGEGGSVPLAGVPQILR
jgi:histidyl-tRNA synthetase